MRIYKIEIQCTQTGTHVMWARNKKEANRTVKEFNEGEEEEEEEEEYTGYDGNIIENTDITPVDFDLNKESIIGMLEQHAPKMDNG